MRYDRHVDADADVAPHVVDAAATGPVHRVTVEVLQAVHVALVGEIHQIGSEHCEAEELGVIIMEVHKVLMLSSL